MLVQKFVIKGSPQDLDGIHRRLSFPPDKGRLEKYSDTNDLDIPAAVLTALGDKPLNLGTTRLEIEFDGNSEELKESILQRFPKVTVA